MPPSRRQFLVDAALAGLAGMGGMRAFAGGHSAAAKPGAESRPSAQAKSKSDRPNLLLLFPDQMRADAMGCAGNPVIKTPHMDRLAAGGVHFPITSREFAGQVRFSELTEGSYEIDGVEVGTMLLSHPGTCLGYRMEFGERSFCYITDNELFLSSSPYFSEHYVERLTAFIEGCDVLVTDAAYSDEGYPAKEGWGHSCVSQVASLAHAANVKNLFLFHHDPDQNDDDIDRKLASVDKRLRELGSDTKCRAPAEGDLIRF